MAKNINDAISIIEYFNNHKEAWERLRIVSLKEYADDVKGDNISLIKFPAGNLIKPREVVTQYEEWKVHLRKLDADFAKTFSASWVPITDCFIVDMAFIDLSKEELPLLLLGCRNDYYVKVACSSLLHFIADYEEDEKRHNLSRVADAYITHTKSIGNTLEREDDLNILFSMLPDLEMDANYVLDDFRPRNLNNSVLWLYARPKSLERLSDSDFPKREKTFECVRICGISIPLKIGGITLLKCQKERKPENPFLHIAVPFTEIGIWQAYLLAQTYHLIGMRWHGGYEARTFISTYEDIRHIVRRRERGMYEVVEVIRKKWSSNLLPSVVLDEDCAYITHCWFDAWKGLVEMKWKAIYDMKEKRICDFQLESEKILVEFNCHIMF